jgi:exopolysaccharide production protein ExoY
MPRYAPADSGFTRSRTGFPGRRGVIDNSVTSTNFAAVRAEDVPVIAPGRLSPELGSSDSGVRTLPAFGEWQGKRVLDLVLAAILTVLLAPVLVLAALAVWLDHPKGPVLFRQRRVGRGNREFSMLKFRSMQPDAEARLHAEQDLLDHFIASDHKIPDHLDPRITRIGRFLRRSSIDEIPQLFNVLAGQMSLVGPRPVERTQLEQYGVRTPYYLAMRPGLTGLWQVGGRSRVTFPARAYLDEQYACQCSLLTDLKILAKTPFAVLRGLNEDK